MKILQISLEKKFILVNYQSLNWKKLSEFNKWYVYVTYTVEFLAVVKDVFLFE